MNLHWAFPDIFPRIGEQLPGSLKLRAPKGGALCGSETWTDRQSLLHWIPLLSVLGRAGPAADG